MRDIKALVADFARPAIQVLAATASSSSHFGGVPAFPTQLPWPTRRSIALAFIARIDLEEVHAVYKVDWLPDTGALFFFSALPLGSSGTRVLDPDVAVVRYIDRVGDAPYPAVCRTVCSRTNIEFVAVQTFPSTERPEVRGLELSDVEEDDLMDLCEESRLDAPLHQIGGYPDAVQNDEMEKICSQTPRARGTLETAHLERDQSAADWRLLLQLDNDETLGLNWGTVAKLYFWVDAIDAGHGRFGNVRAIIQSF